MMCIHTTCSIEFYQFVCARGAFKPKQRRMAKSVEEISHWPEYDYVVVNDDVDKTEEKLKIIITAERLRLSQQPGIVEFVRSLNNEFGER